MAVLLTGKPVADAISADIRARAEALLSKGVQPRLVLLRCGDNEADGAYIRGAVKGAALCGVAAELRTLPADASADVVAAAIDAVNRDPAVHGCLLLRPLPPHLRGEESDLCARLTPDKDVDGFTPVNVGRMVIGEECFLPCTPAGIMELLRAYGISAGGKRCVVIGRSNIVGKPAALLLTANNATVTLCHSKTRDLKAKCAAADIIVAAIGKAGFVTADMVKAGAVVIDVAINRNDAGKLCGDVDFAGVEPIASYITPVPGGVGPMTRAMLMSNIVTAARLHTK